MIKKYLTIVVSVLLIALFMYAAISKLTEYEKFRFQLGRSPFISEYADWISWLIPIAEIIIAMMLIADRTRVVGLYLSFTLMLLFTGYIYAMLHYSYYIPCSCGGVLSNMSWVQHLAFNSVFTLLPLITLLADTIELPDKSKKLLKTDSITSYFAKSRGSRKPVE